MSGRFRQAFSSGGCSPDGWSAPTWRNGEAAVGVAVSVAVTAGLYIPLNRLMDTPDLGMSSYAQYVVPLIVMQAIAFASISTAFRAASDSVQDQPAVPVTARAGADAAGGEDHGECLPLRGRPGRRTGVRPRHRLPFLPRTAECPGFLCAGTTHRAGAGALVTPIGTKSRDPAATAQWRCCN